MTNPWVQFFEDLRDKGHLIKATRVPAIQIDPPCSNSADEDALTLSSALKRVFVPTTRSVIAMQQILAHGATHARSVYRNQKSLISGVYRLGEPLRELLRTQDRYAVLLTGPAGVGKSSLMHALMRATKLAGVIDTSDHGCIPLLPLAYARVQGGTGLADILGQMAQGDATQGTVGHLMVNAQRHAFKHGTCISLLDELQFKSASPTASTDVSKMLLSLLLVGPCLVYAANYSLVHKLMRRPVEEVQRLLSCPIVLLPEPSDSADFVSILSEYRAVCPAVLQFDPRGDAADIYHMSAGQNRLIIHLLTLGYKEARRAGRGYATLADIRLAYGSSHFEANRQKVEETLKQSIQGPVNGHSDVWCPFSVGEQIDSSAALKVANERQKALNDAALRSSLDATERANLKDAEKKAKARAPKEGTRRKSSVTAEDLLRNHAAFRKR